MQKILHLERQRLFKKNHFRWCEAKKFFVFKKGLVKFAEYFFNV